MGASACRQGQLLLQRRRWTEGFARSLIRSQSLSRPLDLKVKGNAERHKAKKGQNTKHVTCNYFHPWNANILLCSSFSILFSSLLGSSSEKWFSKKRNDKNQIDFICWLYSRKGGFPKKTIIKSNKSYLLRSSSGKWFRELPSSTIELLASWLLLER